MHGLLLQWEGESENMEMDTLWLSTSAVVLVSCGALYGILKRVNQWYYWSTLGAKMNLLPPADMGWPLLGNTLSFFRAFNSINPDSIYENLFQRYGRTGLYKTHLFTKPTIIITAPEISWRVLQDSERYQMRYPKSTVKLAGKKGLHGVSRAEHNRIRRLIAAPLSGQEALSLYICYAEDLVIKALDKWASSDKPIEFVPEMKKLLLSVLARVFLGPSDASALARMEELYVDIGKALFSLPINFPGFTFHKGIQSRNELLKIFSLLVAERRVVMKENDQQKCMMDLLIEMEDEEGGKLDEDGIGDLLLGFLLAGSDTSNNLAVWTMIHLHQYPEVFQMAKQEQEEIISKRPSTQKGLNLKEIKEMHYLRKIFDETLRVVFITFSLFGEAKVDVNFNGFLIPKGWTVFPSTRAIHMDPENFFNPKSFDPSRWDDRKAKLGAFLPFGGGSRICPGAELIKVLISTFLHHFLLNYRFKQLNPMGKWKYFPVALPADNCLAKFQKL